MGRCVCRPFVPMQSMCSGSSHRLFSIRSLGAAGPRIRYALPLRQRPHPFIVVANLKLLAFSTLTRTFTKLHKVDREHPSFPVTHTAAQIAAGTAMRHG